MDLKDFPAVVVDEGRGMLYVMCVVGAIGRNSDRKLVLRASRKSKRHEEIFLKLLLEEAAQASLNAVCLGGGCIYIDQVSKKIFIWSNSSDYGREPREKTEKLLKEVYPDHDVIVDQSPFAQGA